MRFAIATADHYLGVFETFLDAGWKALKLFTLAPTADVINHEAVSALAERHGVPVQFARLRERDLAALRDQGCEALIVACYPWRVGPWQPYLKYAVNFHCSPLPEARGPYPVHRAILEGRTDWGVSCHRLTEGFDEGAILTSESFALQPDECHEKIDLKIQMAAKTLARRLAIGLDELWAKAVPQVGGSYWPLPTLEDRVIDFQWPVDMILRHVKAYGSTESLAKVGGRWLTIKRIVGWPERHGFEPGQVVHLHRRTLVIAAADGFVGLVEADLAPPSTASVLSPRHAGGQEPGVEAPHARLHHARAGGEPGPLPLH